MAKKPTESFKSIQILSAKAQSLWSKARERMQNAQDENGSEDITPPLQKTRSLSLIEIRIKTVIKVTLAFLLISGFASALFVVRDKLLILFLAFFIAIVIDNSVRKLESIHIPRSVAVLFIYLVFISIALFLIASLIPIVALQLQDFARFLSSSADTFLANPNIHFPFFSENMNNQMTFLLQEALQSMGIKDRASALLQFGQNLSLVAQSSVGFAVQAAGSVLNFIVNLILILVLAFFIQLEKEKILEFLRALLPREYRSYYDTKADAVYQKITQWFQGQLILCVTIGLLVFIALIIIGEPLSPYAQTLGLLAGFTEFIPYAGPIIAAVPAVFIAVSKGHFFLALIVIVVYYVIQTCENNLLVPLIMKRAVGLSPIAIMFGMMIGVSFPGTVHPVIGIILAVPTTAIITIFVQDFYLYRKKR